MCLKSYQYQIRLTWRAALLKRNEYFVRVEINWIDEAKWQTQFSFINFHTLVWIEFSVIGYQKIILTVKSLKLCYTSKTIQKLDYIFNNQTVSTRIWSENPRKDFSSASEKNRICNFLRPSIILIFIWLSLIINMFLSHRSQINIAINLLMFDLRKLHLNY